jgi:hypothetical protein
MVLQKQLKVAIVLMMSICCTLFNPSFSNAQTDVTLSVSDGAGVRGSFYGNPNYPDGNRVAVSLDNPADKVGILQVDICSADLGGHLQFSGYEVAPRAQALNHSISFNDISQCVEVRFSWTQPFGTVYIAEGTGTVATLNFDVSQFAPGGNCPAGGDLTMSGVNVNDETGVGVLTVTEDPGKFCYYNCGSDLHCDDGLFCNGAETCFNNAWCIDSFFGDPCAPLLCDEAADTCYCDADVQCDDGLWCTGGENCNVGTGECEATPPCSDDGDPCTDDCDESTQTCPFDCNAAGPWDTCCLSSSTCSGASVCNEEVTLTIGDGSGARSSTGNEVILSLANPGDEVRAVQVEMCDGDDYLTVQTNCVPSGRVPAGDYACQCNELPSGCASCALSPNLGVFDNILTGTGPLFTVKYDVSGDAPFGQCRDLSVNTEGSLLVLSGKVCSEGSSNPGTACVFDADCPGGACVSNQLVTLPVDGEFCVPCTTDPGCWDGNDCTTDSCVGGLCVNPNLTGACDDGDPCTDNDQCQKAAVGTKNECVGTDPCADDGDYCTGVEYCTGGVCDDTGNPCASSCNDTNDVCVGSDVTLIIEDASGWEGVIPIALENSVDEVGEVHLDVCDADKRFWLHISADSCINDANRTGGFNCITTDLGNGCVGVDIISNFPLDSIPTGTGAIAYLNYTVDPVTIPQENYADIDPRNISVLDDGAVPLSVTPQPGKVDLTEYCEGDFEGDTDVDAIDVAAFLIDFGRSRFFNPCSGAAPCNGDFDCDTDVDSQDLAVFLEDFGRSLFNNPCPPSSPLVCPY